MANRFWVGGTATWDTTTTANWSTTSGGASGASVPGSADVAVFDGGSGAAVVTASGTLNGTTLQGITLTGTGGFAGTLDFSVNNPSMTLGAASVSGLNISGSGTRTVKLGGGTFTIATSNVNAFDATTTTGLTFIAGTSTLKFTQGPNNAGTTFACNNLTFNNVIFDSRTNGETIFINNGATYNNLTINGTIYITGAGGVTHTVSGTLTVNGSATNGVLFASNNSSPLTLSCAAAPSITGAMLRGITISGVGAGATATNCFDLGSNVGLTITAPTFGSAGGVFGS